MKHCTGGDGSDTTSAVAAYLLAGNEIRLATLYLIGEMEDPASIWLTDYESPLRWPLWGTFSPAVIKRGTVTSQIGLEVASLDVEWTPKTAAYTQSTLTASPYQLAQIGYYDNWKFRAWTVYMPTPGDANTFGTSELFGGRVGKVQVQRGKLTLTINSFLDVVNEQVPTNVIESTNITASYKGATPPTGFSVIPQFTPISLAAGVVVGDCTFPTAHHVFSDNAFNGGYLYFNRDATSSLGGLWSPIQFNKSTTVGGTPYNLFSLLRALPWGSFAGANTFYVSAPFPINQQDGQYLGFPYVPPPSSAA